MKVSLKTSLKSIALMGAALTLSAGIASQAVAND